MHNREANILLNWFYLQASVSDSVRKRILKERAVPKIEEFWFMTDHEFLRAAAAELLLNLLFCEDFYKDTVKVGLAC